MLWVNVMNQFRKGILGLSLLNTEANKWGQAYTQGAFVFAMWIYKNKKVRSLILILPDNFYIHHDEKLLVSEGKDLI